MPLVLAHRGVSAGEAENTIAAFRAAATSGADGVELDARRLGDGGVAVHHGPNLPDGRLLADLAATDLPSGVPVLGEVLDACPDLLVNIEIKNWSREADHDLQRRLAAAVVATVRNHGAVDRVLVSSFDLGSIDRVRRLAPELAVAWNVSMGLRRSLLARCVRHGVPTLHPWDRLVTAAFVTAARVAGVSLNVWTVNSGPRARRLAGWGVAGIITDVPDLVLAALDPVSGTDPGRRRRWWAP